MYKLSCPCSCSHHSLLTWFSSFHNHHSKSPTSASPHSFTISSTPGSYFTHNNTLIISFIIIIMLDFLFCWRKASTCKRLIRRIECRLNLLNSKRRAIVRQVRDDLGLLLKLGHHDQTLLFTKVEQLYMDEIIINVYELLCHFAQFISINLPCIHRHHKDCPNDVNEAISSLIFASARCGDVPELRDFRDMIQQQFGHRFVNTALQLLPGNLVNDQIKEKLSVTSASDEAKFRMVNAIYREFCIPSRSLAIQYSQEWHQKQVTDEYNVTMSDDVIVPDKKLTYKYEVQRYATNSVSDDCFSLQSKHLVNTVRDKRGIVLQAQDLVNVTAMENVARVSRVPSSSSCSDVSVHLLDENLVYLDDVEEFRSPKLYDCSSMDTRVFMFKSPPLVNGGQSQLQSRMKGRLRRTKSRKVRKMASSRESVNFESLNVASEPLQLAVLPSNVFKLQSYVASPVAEQSRRVDNQSEVMKKRAMREDDICSLKSSNGSNSVAAAPTSKSIGLTCYIKDAETHYLRAFTMPAAPQRSKDQGLLEMHYSRTCSLPVPPNHVHPKLPDCDQIEAKFSALKQVYQHTQSH